MSEEKYKPEIIKAAQAAQVKYPKVFASVTLAQFALESGYGLHDLGVFNYFGIKARDGEPYVVLMTREYKNGKAYSTLAKFRSFKSPEEAFMAHAALFYRKRLGLTYIYANALKTTSPDAFAHALTGVYATDPHYGTKLETIMKQDNLYQYDVNYHETPKLNLVQRFLAKFSKSGGSNNVS